MPIMPPSAEDPDVPAHGLGQCLDCSWSRKETASLLIPDTALLEIYFNPATFAPIQTAAALSSAFQIQPVTVCVLLRFTEKFSCLRECDSNKAKIDTKLIWQHFHVTKFCLHFNDGDGGLSCWIWSAEVFDHCQYCV